MAKSLQQFREWAVKAGRVGNPSGGSYPGQCVSLVQQYLNQVFGVPYKARGNAKDFVPPGFKYIGTRGYKPGDIIRYGANYGGGYGHIGLIDDTGAFLDQNGSRPLGVYRRSTPFSGIQAIYRPTKKFNVKTPKPAPKPKPKKKSETTIAKEVIAGKWGNGTDRIKKLKKAGYNPTRIQAIVNKLLR